MPDLFFSNEKEGHFHNIIMPNVYIRIFPNGSVLYSIRISLTLACPMNLKLYPLDRQICSLRMASCKYKLLKSLSHYFCSVLVSVFLSILKAFPHYDCCRFGETHFHNHTHTKFSNSNCCNVPQSKNNLIY